jgi:hypothetical protein
MPEQDTHTGTPPVHPSVAAYLGDTASLWEASKWLDLALYALSYYERHEQLCDTHAAHDGLHGLKLAIADAIEEGSPWR